MLEEYKKLLAKLQSLNHKAENAQIAYNEKLHRHEIAKQLFAKESMDVDKLKSESLSAFLQRVIGHYDKKLDKEVQEQLAAKRELDLSLALLMEARDKLDFLQASIQEVSSSLHHLKMSLLQNDGAFQEKISAEEMKRAELNQEVKELDEALTAGEQVLDGIDYALEDLDSADSYSTWDMFTDSSLIFDMLKYDKIDKAETKMTQLERLLQVYSTELKDVALDNYLNYEKFSGMSKSFDIFFDNLFSDWDTKAKIGRNIEMLENLGTNIEDLQDKLIDKKEDILKQMEDSERWY